MRYTQGVEEAEDGSRGETSEFGYRRITAVVIRAFGTTYNRKRIRHVMAVNAWTLPHAKRKRSTRAAVETLTVGDWADHYSQVAIYLRLNNLLPPTAKKPEK